MNRAAARRKRLFRKSTPLIRPAQYQDIRWCWAAARRQGFDGQAEEFSAMVEPRLAEADRLFILEDKNNEFSSGSGPVGIVLANYDGWTLAPHVEWFPWAGPRNILRCTVGFLQSMRYTHDVGVIKIFSEKEYVAWFKWLKRYVGISLAGRIPHGRKTGEECIFYLRGRKRHESRQNLRRIEAGILDKSNNDIPTARDIA